MRRNGLIATLIGALTLGSIAFGTSAFALAPPSASLPIPDPTIQSEYESEVTDFLANNPKPETADFGYSVDGQNQYWRAMAAWWESVPWVAVAGQWGCESQAVGVTFNPPDSQGVITAGRGGTGSCGGVSIGGNQAIFSIPESRSTIVEADPDSFK